MNELCGVINIYKESNFTSHDVVNIVRKSLNKIKTGHTGTLDPQAEGVLPICIGKATKISNYILSDMKEYKTQLTLGIKTTTYDATGDIIQTRPVLAGNEEIKNTILSFKGEYSQLPPMYSAIKFNGKKLYEFAREGKEVERKKRNVKIYDISDINFIGDNKVEFKVLCSKGTYIRSLCNDIGDLLKCGAYMSYLLRTRTGNFYVEDSIKINDFKEIVNNGNIGDILIGIEDIMNNLKKIYVNSKANKFLYNGNKISFNYVDETDIYDNEKVLIYDFKNTLIGIYDYFDGFFKPDVMLI